MALHRGGLVGADHAGKEPVLRVILKVATGVRCALDVGTGSVKTVVTSPQGIFTDQIADLVHQIRIEGCGEDTAAGIAHGAGIFLRVVRFRGKTAGIGAVRLSQTRRTIVIQRFRLVDGIDFCSTTHTERNHIGIIVP